MRRHLVCALSVVLLLGIAGSAAAHCQIPCGIYDDELRVQLVEEHITTIEKSMQEIAALSGTTPLNHHQLIRWVMNKEDHAEQLQEIVAAYFMTQRITAPATTEGDEYRAYVTRLSLLHEMLVAAMKAKQTHELAHVAKLRDLVRAFRLAYFGEKAGHSH